MIVYYNWAVLIFAEIFCKRQTKVAKLPVVGKCCDFQNDSNYQHIAIILNCVTKLNRLPETVEVSVCHFNLSSRCTINELLLTVLIWNSILDFKRQMSKRTYGYSSQFISGDVWYITKFIIQFLQSAPFLRNCWLWTAELPVRFIRMYSGSVPVCCAEPPELFR